MQKWENRWMKKKKWKIERIDEGRVEEMNGRNCGKKTFGYEGMKEEVKELMKNEESQGMNKEDSDEGRNK